MSNAENVISAKAKSMHGLSLKKDDYKALVNKKSVSEITSFLKHSTSYEHVLKDVRENTIHRGQLEVMLRNEHFQKMQKMMIYASAKQKAFYALPFIKMEIDIILEVIRSLINGKQDDSLLRLPFFIEGTTLNFSIQKMVHINTFDALLSVLNKSPYYKLLLPYRVTAGKEHEIKYTDLENTLYQYLYKYRQEVIEKACSKSGKETCLQLLYIDAEIHNIALLYRGKFIFHMDHKQLTKFWIPMRYRITKQKEQQLQNCSNKRTFFAILQDCGYYISDDQSEYFYLEAELENHLYQYANRNMYQKSDAQSIYFSYLYILRKELDNLINIIEGVRYGLSQNDIEKMLVY